MTRNTGMSEPFASVDALFAAVDADTRSSPARADVTRALHDAYMSVVRAHALHYLTTVESRREWRDTDALYDRLLCRTINTMAKLGVELGWRVPLRFGLPSLAVSMADTPQSLLADAAEKLSRTARQLLLPSADATADNRALWRQLQDISAALSDLAIPAREWTVLQTRRHGGPGEE